MFSTWAISSNTAKHRLSKSASSASDTNGMHPHQRSNTSSRAISLCSVSTASSLSQRDTIRRQGQLTELNSRSAQPQSPNPLRAPPQSLLRLMNDNSTLLEDCGSVTSFAESSGPSLETPIVAFPELKFHVFPNVDGLSANGRQRVWIIVSSRCSLFQSGGAEPSTIRKTDWTPANNPGGLRSVTMALDPLQDCQILNSLGNRTSVFLSPGETMTTICLVALNPRFFSQGKTHNQKQSNRLGISLSRRKPTSDLLNEELMKQLSGPFKPTKVATESDNKEEILKVGVTYSHSLFPASHHTTYETAFSVSQSTVRCAQQDPQTKPKLKKGKSRGQCGGNGSLNPATTVHAAESISRVLYGGLQFDKNIDNISISNSVDASTAVGILNDFLSAATHLRPDTSRNLEMLKFRYSMLFNANQAKITPSPKRYSPFDRQRHTGERNRLGLELDNHCPCPAEIENKRRNAFELQREELNFEPTLTDVTNKVSYRGRDSNVRRLHIPRLERMSDIHKVDIVPPPLFSPKKSPSLVYLTTSARTPPSECGRTSTYDEYVKNERGFDNVKDIGTAKFYEAEVEDMARQAFGGATISQWVHREHRIQFIEGNLVADSPAHDSEEEGNMKARTIWERMRVSSEGSGTTGESTEAKYGDQTEDKAEWARECKVIGAPWIA